MGNGELFDFGKPHEKFFGTYRYVPEFCGFKQLQYMAVGVPFVSSWVGGARDFVVDGENGLVALEEVDWYRHLKALLDSPELRTRLARNGRALVETQYSVEQVGPRVVSYFERILGDATAS